MIIDGVQVVVLVDYESGMLLGEVGIGVDMEVVVVGNIEVICVKMKIVVLFNFNDMIEDILILLGCVYYILCLVVKQQGLFIYLVFDCGKFNLVLVWCKVQDVESQFVF